MSGSTGQTIGYAVGAVVGYFIGDYYDASLFASAALGASVGGAIGAAIDPPKGPKLTGPRLADLSQQTASYGTDIPRVYGSVALFGNVFWIENNALKETSTTTGGGKGGGSKPQTTTYRYSATFALGLCRGPIAGIRRIWVTGKLIYDAGSDDISTVIASNKASSKFTIYTGSETQSADPRMQATLGVANTPAFRGLAYIVFEDFDLTNYGNTLAGAQIKVEVVCDSSLSYALKGSETLSGNQGYTAFDFNSNGVSVALENGFQVVSGDSYSQLLLAPDLSLIGRKSFINQGDSPGDNRLFIAGGNADYQLSSDATNGNCRLIANGRYVADLAPYATAPGNWWYNEPAYSFPGYSGLAWFRNSFLYLGVHRTGGSVGTDWNRIMKFSVPGALSPEAATALHPDGRVLPGAVALDVDEGFVSPAFLMHVTEDGQTIHAVTTTLKLKTYDADLNLLSTDNLTFLSALPDAFAIDEGLFYSLSGTQLKVYNMASGALLSTIALSSANGAPFRVQALGQVVYVQSGNYLYVFTFNILSSNEVTLSSIVQSEVLNSQLIGIGDINVSSLTDVVRGYRVSATAAIRSGLEPLQAAWPFDIIQDGYKVKFIRRGTASSVATITEDELDARKGGEAPGVRLTKSREMNSQLPWQVTLKYLDIDREYDTNAQNAQRQNTDSANIQSSELPIVLTAAEAAQKAEILLYLYWLERYDLSLSLPPSYNGLQPSDVVTLQTTDADYRLRLSGINYASDNRLECTAKLDSPATYASSASADTGTTPTGTIALHGPSAYALLDIPTLKDSYDMPGFAVAMCGYLNGWSSGTVFRSLDGAQTWSALNSFTQPSAIGYAMSILDAPNDTRMVDGKSAVQVKLYQGELSSISEALMLNGGNHFAFGDDGRWEIIAARTCTLQGDGSYILSDLLRGRFGTEWACGTHQPGDRVVLLSEALLQFANASLNQIGVSAIYRGISGGDDLSSDSDLTFAYQGVNLECLSPVYLNGNRNPTTKDWSLSWTRRTRVGGEWRDYVDASLGEASEAYEIDIYTGADYTTVKRTLSGLTSAAATYTSAQQVADFGNNQATLYLKIYQLSASVGRGTPLVTSIKAFNPSSPYAEVLNDSPILYLPLDDASGATCVALEGSNAMISGASYTRGSSAIGQYPASTYLTSRTSDTRIVSALATNLPEFTVEVIFIVDALTSLQTLVSKSSYYATAPADFPFRLFINADGSIEVDVDSGNDYTTDCVIKSAAGTIVAGTKYHVGYVHRDNGLCEFYLNESLVGSSVITFAISQNARYWTWGCSSYPNGGGAGASGFQGKLVGAALFSAALPADRIAAHASLRN